MKKNYRIIQKYLNYVFIKIISFFLEKLNYKTTPSLAKIDKFDFNYSEKTRRLVFNNSKEKFGKIIIDTSLFKSELCEIGKNHKGNLDGKFHLKLNIKSLELKKLSRIESNKMIYKILDKELKEFIHSIQILIT